ncbi:unnamed protein product [Ectocarpus sp. CCAP 1310/34]|nr:unnamed protein product [Ectocarpus sp. CCAP 1310/34]
MAPMRAACLIAGLAASSTAVHVPESPVYSLQGGGSGLETKGDYLENKIARGVYGSIDTTAKGVVGVFGLAADEAKQANKAAHAAARSARESARESVKHVRESVHIPTKIGWPFEEKAPEPEPKMSWVGGAKQVVADERTALKKFFGNPNNAFVAQGVTALLFGGLHLAKYDQFVGKLAQPLCSLFGLEWGPGTVGPYMKLMGAYLLGVFFSDVLAYKSNSAGFKRGKIWHEMGSCIAISALCITQMFSETPADVVPHAIAAFVFAGWYGYLSQQY